MAKGTYAARRKSRGADYYGIWKDGKRITPEQIAGTTLTYTPGKEK